MVRTQVKGEPSALELAQSLGRDAMNRKDINYRLVVDSTPALVFSARPDGYVDYFNQRWFDYFGVPLAALEGWGWMSFIHPDDREEHLRRWRTSIVDGQPAVSQSRVADAKGEYRWMLHRTEPLCDEAGNVIRWFGTTGVAAKQVESLCRQFDLAKGDLFNPGDVERGFFRATDRRGQEFEVLLVTLSVAVVPCEALQSAERPGALAQVAASLKSKVKQMTSASRRSEFLFERRKLRPVP